MKLIHLYKQKIDSFSILLGQACMVFYYACIIISVIEVFRRYVLNMPSEWAFETVMALCASAWILSAGYVTQQRRHIAITVLEMVVQKKTWRGLILVQLILAVLAVIGLAVSMYEPALDSIAIMETSGSAFDTAAPPYLKTLLLVGSILYVMQLLANIVQWFCDGPDKQIQ